MKNEIKDKSTFILKRNFLSFILFVILMNFNMGNILSSTRGTSLEVRFTQGINTISEDYNCLSECSKVKVIRSDIMHCSCIERNFECESFCSFCDNFKELDNTKHYIMYVSRCNKASDTVKVFTYDYKCEFAKGSYIYDLRETASTPAFGSMIRHYEWKSVTTSNVSTGLDSAALAYQDCEKLKTNNFEVNSAINLCRSKCIKYAPSGKTDLYIGDKKITNIGEFLDEIPVTELIKVYDPNMVNY